MSKVTSPKNIYIYSKVISGYSHITLETKPSINVKYVFMYYSATLLIYFYKVTTNHHNWLSTTTTEALL